MPVGAEEVPGADQVQELPQESQTPSISSPQDETVDTPETPPPSEMPSPTEEPLLTEEPLEPGLAPFSPQESEVYGLYFSDVPDGKWYTEAINSLASRGVIGGVGGGEYRPNQKVTRAEFIKMLSKISGKSTAVQLQTATFTDVPEDKWFAPYVKWAVKDKVAAGTGQGTFSPNQHITRQEMAVILWRFTRNAMGRQLPKRISPSFSDSHYISLWAKTEVMAVASAQLLKGYGDRTFRPGGGATRAETAQLIYRYLMEYQNYGKTPALDDMRVITHGGGAVSGYTVSNSLEALNESYRNNNKVIEVDLSWTTDGQLVCLHNWGGDFPQRMTLSNFKKQRIYGFLTPIGLDELAGWMASHPDVKLVPDFKERNVDGLRIIANRYPALVSRIYPYIYHLNELDAIKGMGYQNMLLGLYQMNWWEYSDFDYLISFVKTYNLLGFSLSGDQMKYAGLAGKHGIPSFIFVVNGWDNMYKYAMWGAAGFFTDDQTTKLQW